MNEKIVNDIIEKSIEKKINREPLAIIGIGCNLPGNADSPEKFWNLLKNGVDALKEVPADRWDVDHFYHPDFNRKGKINTREGGFIENIDLFDASFFEIPPIEAMRMDPQQRILLEVVFQAIEDAGLKLENLSGSKTGVLIGISCHDYGDLSLLPTEHATITGATIQGGSASIAANRISYIFNLKGISLAIDTACSSSLNALHVACRSLWEGDTNQCIVGGVNLLLRPETQMTFSKGGFLSPDSRCKAFDASANGYIRGEGAGAVIIKPLKQALLDKDNIYALIIGTATNQDGRTTGLPMPSLESQIEMLKAAYQDAGIDTTDVSYIEAHGTGTAIGDFTEGTSIGTVVGKTKKAGEKLLIGSVKTNIGHLESGSGIAGLIKLSLVLKNRQVPPNNHFKTPNPKIPFEDYNLQVPTRLMDLKKNGSPLYAGINSFGFGGANAHAVLQAPPVLPAEEVLASRRTGDAAAKQARLLVLSAKTAPALQGLAEKYSDFLSQTPEELTDICYSAGARRSALEHRLALAAYSKEEFREKLAAFIKGEPAGGLVSGRQVFTESPQPVFVYSGQGPQWWAMGRQLLKEEPVFRQAVEQIQEILQTLGWLKEEGSTLIKELEKDENSSRINETCIAQPAIFAVQVGLTEVWKARGVRPAAIVGHSIGEVAASYVSGALSLEEATRVVYWRSRCQMQAEGKGSMLAVALNEEQAKAKIRGYEDKVAVAVINGPGLLTLAGDTAALEELAGKFSSENIFNRAVKVSVPFHSPYMDPIKEEFLSRLGKIEARETKIPLYSTVTAARIKGQELTAAYWYRNIREPVYFYPAVKQLVAEDYKLFIEISPHPILAKSIEDTCNEAGKKGYVVASLRRQEDEQITLTKALAQLFIWGYALDWSALSGGTGRFIKLPYYAWQKERYWMESGASQAQRLARPAHPHLNSAKTSPKEKDAFIWDIVLDKRLDPYIDDHKVQGPIIYPGAGHCDLALAAGLASFKEKFGFLEGINFKNALFLPDDGEPPQIQLEIQANEGHFCIASRPRYSEMPWTIHSYGRMNHMGDVFGHEDVDLKAIRQRLTVERNVATLYEGLFKSGLHLGATFQGIKKLWSTEQESLSEIHVHDELKIGFEHFNIHPCILDACFQTLFGIMHTRPDGAWMAGVYIPVFIERFKFYTKPSTHTIWCYTKLISHKNKRAVGRLWIIDDNNRLVAEVEGFTCQYLEGSRGEKAGELDNCLYEYVPKRKSRLEEELNRTPGEYITSPVSLSKELNAYVKNEIVARPLHKKFLEDFDAKLEKMGLTYMVNSLREMGIGLEKGQTFAVDELIKKCSIVERHYRLFHFIFSYLQSCGYLKALPESWEVITEPCRTLPQEMMSQLLEKYPEFAYELTLLERCGSRLTDVLQGRQDPIQLIFPENEWDAIVTYYMQAHSFKMYNDMVQQAIPLLLKNLPADQTLRVVEVGAGTGGMTQAILPVLPADRTEYFYTDLSHMFMLKAQQRFSRYPFVQYSLLDLEKDPAGQGFLPHSFDIVVASDVVHATRNVKETLGKIRELLAPEGLLIMLEVTKSPLYNDLVFGLTEGWWLFEDTDIRPQHPTMPIKQWVSVLESAGFHSVLPLSDVPENDKSSQTVFFARNGRGPAVPATKETEAKEAKEAAPDPRRTPGSWVLFKDKSSLAADLKNRLEQDNKVCYLVTPGSAFKQVSGREFEINPASKEDMHRLWAEILKAGTAPLQGVVHLWSFNGVANEKLSPSVLEESQAVLSQAAVNLAHELNDLPHKPQLWLVTGGAEVIEGIDDEPVLSQSTMRGLGRVIINEQPGLKTSLVDLSREPSADELANLYEEFWTAKQEDEITFRGKKRFLNIFTRILPARAQQLAQKKVPGVGHAYHAEITEYGVLDNLLLREKERKAPGPDEVEIEIHASALNFRDIMIAMGLLSDEAVEGGIFGRNFGLECAGRISAIGRNVSNFKVGDKVIAIASDCIGSYTVTPVQLVAHKPGHLSYKEATTIPLVYLTAHYALNYLCRMRRGEKVLIHAGTGGVGLAAINLARHAGAEIYTTAGSEEKRAYLRSLGIKYVYDSRSLTFKDDVLKDTNGQGVDIILNSLAGKAIHQNLHCLAPYGRFVEIGKTDIYNNTRIGLKPFGQNLAYFCVDVDRLSRQRTELAGELLKELTEFFSQKTFEPHPFREYPVSRVAEAFQALSQSRHIGKIVLDMEEPEIVVSPASEIRFKKDGTYLIVGGCGGFGLAVAKWMVTKGAGHMVLMGRSGVKAEEEAQLAEMTRLGAVVKVMKGDISRPADVEQIIGEIQKTLPPLKGVIHSALVLEDAPLREMTLERFMIALRPKAIGAWNLHQATLDIPLDYFIMFSSIATSFGSPGQCNYAAGNAFMERLADYRRMRGLTANVISWGTLAEVGFVARSGKVKDILDSQGWRAFKLQDSLVLLEKLLLQNVAHRTAADVEWSEIAKFFEHNTNSMRFGHLYKEKGSGQLSEGGGSLYETLSQAPAEERYEILVSQLRDAVARILGTASNKLDIETALTKLGLDSLMANQIRNWIHNHVKVDYSLMKVMKGPSITEIAKELLGELKFTTQGAAAPAVDGKQTGGIAEAELERWVVRTSPRPAAKMRLFCFAYMGAGASIYHKWAGSLPEEIEVCAIQLPGREDRSKEQPLESISELENALTAVISRFTDKPFAFFGHSFGARLAFRLACVLEKNHNLKPTHVFVAATLPPHINNPLGKIFENHRTTKASEIPEELIITLLRKLGVKESVFNNKELLAAMLPAIRGDIRLMQMDNVDAHSPITSHLVAIASEQDEVYSIGTQAEWKKYSGNGFALETIPGSHLFIHEETSLKILFKLLKDILLNNHI